MSYKYWLLFSSLALGATHNLACSSKFSSCEARRTCPSGGAAGTTGTAGARTAGGDAGGNEGGSGGVNAQAGEAGDTSDAGRGGMAGDSSVNTELEIASPGLELGKTYVPFRGKISASGAAHYTWSITSGTLPAGLALQGTRTATVTIAGTPSEAGQFPISLSVTDGSTTKTVAVTLTVTHSALFLSDRSAAGANDLFLSEIGADSATESVRLNASLPSGGSVTNYAWSPDGSKVLYLATQAAGGSAGLWVASLAAPGTAQRVSTVGVNVSQMVWLLAGNIAAYMDEAGNAYLVDLSSSTPGLSKLVVPAAALPGALTPSPNGTSLTVGTFKRDANSIFALATVSYVTWADPAPTSITIFQSAIAEQSLHFSYDGRYGATTNLGGTAWWDLSSVSPTAAPFTNENGGQFSFSPNARALVYVNLVASPTPPARLSLGRFDSGSMVSSPLIPEGTCIESTLVFRWSMDGRHFVFRCNNDIRGISGVMAATVGADFSLVPAGFLANTFTDTPSVAWSPDSKWIALRADRDTDTRYDLHLIRWSAPGTTYKPHSNTIGAGVSTWAFAQNSQSVAFVGSIAPQSNAGLYLTTLPTTGAPPSATLVSSPANAVVQTDINWLPGSRVIAYRATVAGAAQLFAVPVAADGTAGTPIPISGPSGSGVTSYQLAPTR